MGVNEAGAHLITGNTMFYLCMLTGLLLFATIFLTHSFVTGLPHRKKKENVPLGVICAGMVFGSLYCGSLLLKMNRNHDNLYNLTRVADQVEDAKRRGDAKSYDSLSRVFGEMNKNFKVENP